jgi:phenylacetate-CoA ligase
MSRLLTQNLFIPLSHARRRRRAAMRPTFEAYEAGMRFRRQTKDWSEAEKTEWILERLRFVVRRAASETDYYQTLFQKINFDPQTDFSFDDFAKLPVLGREDIHDAKDALISRRIPKEQLEKDATGGSTGTPTEIWLGAEERGWKESGLDFSMEKIGVPIGAKLAYFWGHHLDPHAADNWRDRLRNFAANIRYFDCFRLSPEIFRKYHREFERWSPDCIVAYASALGHFAEFLKENNIRPKNYPRVCFVTGAEKLFPEHRQIIEEVFGKPVYERYGGRDFGVAAIQTNPPVDLSYETDWSWLLIEPETDAEMSPILVTKLQADAMPMIRYRVGDVGKFPAGSRSGRPAFHLRAVVGRELDRIWLPDGRWIHGIELPHLLKSYAVREFMFVQAEDYTVELLIVPKDSFGESDRREIWRTVQANLQGLTVDVKLTKAIPRTKANKWRPVMTKVKR